KHFGQQIQGGLVWGFRRAARPSMAPAVHNADPHKGSGWIWLVLAKGRSCLPFGIPFCPSRYVLGVRRIFAERKMRLSRRFQVADLLLTENGSFQNPQRKNRC